MKPTVSENGTTLDFCKWVGKAGLDIIGLAGFGYEFDTLHDPENELATAFEKMFSDTMVSQLQGTPTTLGSGAHDLCT